MHSSLLSNHFHFLGQGLNPTIELWCDNAVQQRVALTRTGSGRHGDESLWLADLSGLLPAADGTPSQREWQFRIDLGDGRLLHPEFAPAYTTTLRSLWMQDGQLFDYQPAPALSPPSVVKIEEFGGSLGQRTLYVYLPRGYAEHEERRYPVLYMHDGQNCFDAFVDDSYAGAWQADLAASLLIRQGLMRECLIVGVSNGREQRILEYLPPYARHLPPPRRPTVAVDHGEQPPPPRRPLSPVPGRAAATLDFYRNEVAPFVAQRYRVLPGRDQTATCGSSLGGLFSVYIAWEHTDFARHHAALSTSFWITRNRNGTLETIERIRTGFRRDIRLWLDSGTMSSPGGGDDGQRETAEARAALLEAGYVEGVDFQRYLAEGATHSEGAWAARLPLILQFLFPTGHDETLRHLRSK
jgi:predicted alpha/beta superfamily hydrolase